MKKSWTLLLGLFIAYSGFSMNIDDVEKPLESCIEYESEVIHIFIGDTALHPKAIEWAYKSYVYLKEEGSLLNDSILTIVDFSQPSHHKRAYIFDLKNHQLLYQKHVAHGMNTGNVYAKSFSNKSGSHQSSFGAYVTTSTYHGKYELAMRLEGIEYSNSAASSRGIVVHAAEYANPSFLQKNGRLGRSFGCPAFPQEDFHEIIELLKGGSCFYIFYPNPYYSKKSKIVNFVDSSPRN